MFKWAQKQLADVAGTKEPIYGPSAIRNVSEQAKTTPYTELKRDDMKWFAMNTTSVETFSFYLISDNGHAALAQVIYSNVAGIRTTCQFNTKIFYPDQKKEFLWCSTQLKDVEFSEDKCNFYAQNCAVELSADGEYYTIKSVTDDRAQVNLTIRKAAPGFVSGKDGKTLFGTDLSNPWGSMRHGFWPRCAAEGTITTADGPIDFKGKALFIHALQGMKPHHAAAKWNYINFQGTNISAILMEYTTPPSYGSTEVNVGGIAKDGEIITGGCSNTITHTRIKKDTDNSWPEPEAIKAEWSGTTKDGKPVTALLETDLEQRLDKIDVMAEVPGFVKQIVAGAVGTKPYIYQYMPRQHKVTLKLKIGDTETIEEGILFSEATFISE
ncbi:survival factor 1 [Diaporthe helianthi]|uniref:Survival factor 1 n=1 Tax=Diaporthe helianthi TaxID=158607 RepID=A0A2P5HWT5_DIAHE|nr:survival factor 1 [Diaporthe helianthi]